MPLLSWPLSLCLVCQQLVKIVASYANFLTGLLFEAGKCLFCHYQVPCLLATLVSVFWPLWVKCQLMQVCFFFLSVYLTFLENRLLGFANKQHFQHIYFAVSRLPSSNGLFLSECLHITITPQDCTSQKPHIFLLFTGTISHYFSCYWKEWQLLHSSDSSLIRKREITQ